MGWIRSGTGELLDAAKRPRSTCRHHRSHIRYQQNLTGRKIAIVVLGKGRWRLIRSGSPLSARAALLNSGRKAFDRELRVLAKDLSLHGAACGQFQAGTDTNRLRPVPHARPCRPARLDQRR